MPLPYFKFYASDWLADPKRSLLTTEEIGAFIELLAHMWTWDDGTCSLPDDDRLIARLLRVNPRTWRRIRRTLVEGETAVLRMNEGRIQSQRLLKEWRMAAELITKNSKAGRKSAESRKAASTSVQPPDPDPEPEPYKSTGTVPVPLTLATDVADPLPGLDPKGEPSPGFFQLWETLNKRGSRAKAWALYCYWVKARKADHRDIHRSAEHYAGHCVATGQTMLHAATFLNKAGEHWPEWVDGCDEHKPGPCQPDSGLKNTSGNPIDKAINRARDRRKDRTHEPARPAGRLGGNGGLSVRSLPPAGDSREHDEHLGDEDTGDTR